MMANMSTLCTGPVHLTLLRWFQGLYYLAVRSFMHTYVHKSVVLIIWPDDTG